MIEKQFTLGFSNGRRLPPAPQKSTVAFESKIKYRTRLFFPVPWVEAKANT